MVVGQDYIEVICLTIFAAWSSAPRSRLCKRNGSASIAAACPWQQPLSVHYMPESRRLLTADRRDGFLAYDLRKPGRVLKMLPACVTACLQV